MTTASGSVSNYATVALDFMSMGTEFWLAFPGNYLRVPGWTNQPPPQLFITGTPGITGSVSVPGLGFHNDFHIPEQRAITVPLPFEADLGEATDVITNKGIQVVASDSIAVCGFNHVPTSTDAYMGLSTLALGTNYQVLAYQTRSNAVAEPSGEQFALVGTRDGTTVTLTLTTSVGPRLAGVPFHIALGQGRPISCAARTRQPATSPALRSRPGSPGPAAAFSRRQRMSSVHG